MEYIVLVPLVESATITPNPVEMNSKFILSVSVREKEIVLEPYSYHSNDIYSGEV